MTLEHLGGFLVSVCLSLFAVATVHSKLTLEAPYRLCLPAGAFEGASGTFTWGSPASSNSFATKYEFKLVLAPAASRRECVTAWQLQRRAMYPVTVLSVSLSVLSCLCLFLHVYWMCNCPAVL